MPERKTLNEDLFYRGSSANLPRLHTCENKTPFWDKSKPFASHYSKNLHKRINQTNIKLLHDLFIVTIFCQLSIPLSIVNESNEYFEYHFELELFIWTRCFYLLCLIQLESILQGTTYASLTVSSSQKTE